MAHLLDELRTTLAGRYVIERELGRGGMAVVYLARDLKHERAVALKVLNPELSQALGAERFVREIKLAARLTHPHILPVLDSGDAEGILYYVMPYVDGGTLRDRLVRGGRMPVADAVRVAAEVADALDYAHREGVLHRDVKPANILLTGYAHLGIATGWVPAPAQRAPGVRWHALLADFGVARAIASAGGDQLTGTGFAIGTPAYMSPEQALGEPALDGRSDVYALGCVLYEMLAGEPPFTAPSAQALIMRHVLEAAPPLRAARDDVPDAVAAAVAAALAKSPDERFASAGEFGLAVRAPESPVRSSVSGTARAVVAPASRDAPPNNLPAELTALIGRDREVAAACELLRRGDVRLLTLTGPGGTGKSRLALRVAAALLEDAPDGCYFVALAPIADPALAPATVAHALGLREESGRAPIETLEAHLRGARMMLVLDNFEHIISAAPVVTELLGAAPGLLVLVTSRVALRVRGEHEFPVPPLEVPAVARRHDAAALARVPAAALFVERARAVHPGFALTDDNAAAVADICVRLDGLPLAIELAAARSKLLPPRAILARLQHRLDLLTGGGRDAPARHQTLREAIAWSYELLGDAERRLFRRLSVFVGAVTLEAADAVCGGVAHLGLDVLDGVASLADKSLLRRDDSAEGDDAEPSFRMLETIREYAAECLAASGEEEAVRRRHRDWCLVLAEDAARQLTGEAQQAWLARLERAQGDFRHALDWCERDPGGAESALRLGIALWRFWLVRGQFTEGRERLARILARADPDARTALRARALTGAGTLAHNIGDYVAARARFEEALAIWREVGDAGGVATALNDLGWMAWRLGDFGPARALSAEGLALHRERGDDRGVATSLNNLGWLAYAQGEFAAAQSFHEESLALRRRLGDARGVGFALTNLARALNRLGEPARALRCLEEALALLREVGDRQLVAWAFAAMAEVALARGDTARAAALLESEVVVSFREILDLYGTTIGLHALGETMRLQGDLARARAFYDESLALRRGIGARHGVAECVLGLAEVAAAGGEWERAAALYDESLATWRELRDAYSAARSLAGLAAVAAARGEPERSARLLGTAEALLARCGAVVPAGDRARYDRVATAARAALGDDAFEAERAAGRELSAEL